MDNPYAAPESVITPIPVHHTEAEQIRQKHLSHEASVKSIGTLYYLGAILLLLVFFGYSSAILRVFNEGAAGGSEVGMLIGGALLMLGLIVFQWILAGGLRKLRPWVRIPTIILSIIGLIGFPIGTLISGYILYLMLSAKSKMIFSPEYQQVIAATPHLRYRTSLLRTVLIVLLVIAVFMAIGFLITKS
jgi:hypothetical protein